MEHFTAQTKKTGVPNTSDRHLMTVLLAGFRRSNDVMFYSNAKGVILDINEAFTAHYGYTREEAIGKTPALLRSSHSTNELYKRMWRSILDPQKGYWRGEWSMAGSRFTRLNWNTRPSVRTRRRNANISTEPSVAPRDAIRKRFMN